MASIPVIDISPLLTPNSENSPGALADLISAWDNAFRTVGFAVITEHGVDSSLTDLLYTRTREFFTQPAEHKLRYCRNEGYGSGGYVPMGMEAVGRTKGKGVKTPDLVESFVHMPGENDPSELPPTIHDPVLGYCDQMRRLLAEIMRLSALCLELDEGYFEQFFKRAELSLRLAYYPPQEDGSVPPEGEIIVCIKSVFHLIPGQLRYGAHTDYTGFTLLRQDSTLSGLQVFVPTHREGGDDDEEGEWIPVPLVPNSYVINAGDLIQHWTNGLWRSNLHRVVNPPASEASKGRLSMVFFTGPNADTVVAPLEECVRKTGGKRVYKPVVAQAYLLEKIKQSNV